MHNPIDEFLDERGVTDPIRSAFIAYCKSLYSSRYQFKAEGDTVKMFLGRMNDEQVLNAWNDFIQDIRSIMPTVMT